MQVEGKTNPIVCSRDDVRVVYPKRYNMPSSGKSMQETHDDLFAGLNEEEARILKEMDDE